MTDRKADSAADLASDRVSRDDIMGGEPDEPQMTREQGVQYLRDHGFHVKAREIKDPIPGQPYEHTPEERRVIDTLIAQGYTHHTIIYGGPA